MEVRKTREAINRVQNFRQRKVRRIPEEEALLVGIPMLADHKFRRRRQQEEAKMYSWNGSHPFDDCMS
jgi:hypothetical protein